MDKSAFLKVGLNLMAKVHEEEEHSKFVLPLDSMKLQRFLWSQPGTSAGHCEIQNRKQVEQALHLARLGKQWLYCKAGTAPFSSPGPS